MHLRRYAAAERGRQQIDLIGHGGVDGRRAALEGNVLRRRLGEELEKVLGLDVRPGADARGTEIDDLAVHGLEEFGQVVGRIIRARRQGFRARSDHRHRLEVIRREWLVLGQRFVDGERGSGRQKRVAIGRGVRDQPRRNVAAGSCAVFDHHTLMQTFAQALCDEPRHCVGKSTGAKATIIVIRFAG